MSELIKWFAKRYETKALTAVQRHLALTTGIVEDLEKAIGAAVQGDLREMQTSIERVTKNEREADELRRRIVDEVSKGELSPVDRIDLMDLVKRVDMVADWNREATRILGAIPIEYVPRTIQDEFVEFVISAKECTKSLQKCINKMMTKPEEALKAADEVEGLEEVCDDIHEKARKLLGKEELPKAGVVVLISQLFEAIEMIADSCEETCDQVRIIMVRK